MLSGEHRALADLAASVADGTPVDWNAVERTSDVAARRLVAHLRLVESIASLHRSIAPDTADDASDPDVGAGDRQPLLAPTAPHWGRLTLLDRIGDGTSCEVFRAWDTALHREVAVKLLRDTADRGGSHARPLDARLRHARLLEEARRLARVRHQHVVQVYGAEEHDGRVGLWMELVRGESLQELVAAQGAFGSREAALIGLDICAALAAVHGAGLLHRDVKAQNVMREQGGRIVLMDFGTGEELAGSSGLVGTPLYLAPEIFRGAKASVQSDLYSLGVLLFYLATGKFPVAAASMEELAQAHQKRERRSLRDLRPDAPEAFVRTIERALDSDPARRFQSVGELESSLRESLEAAAGPGFDTDRAARVTPIPRRRLGTGFLVAAAALVVTVGALLLPTRPWSGAVAPVVNRLAVLPLVAHAASTPPEFADAVTERLIATVGEIESLQTTSLMSTLRFKGNSQPRAEIASLLGVDAIVEGVLDVVPGPGGDPGRVRLDAHLIAAASGARLWSGSFERPRGDVNGLLSDTATAIAEAVNAPVSGAEAARLRQRRQTNPAAEEAYLQGRLHLAHYGAAAAGRALEAFNRAIALDDSHGAAYGGAALAYVRLGDTGSVTMADARLSALANIRKAFDRGDDNAEVHAALAETKFLYDWDWHGAEREYRRSLDLNPGFVYARSVYAQLLAVLNRFDEAIALSRETLRLDPQSSEALVNHGLLLYYQRDFAAAGEIARRLLQQEPASVPGHLLAWRVAEAEGRGDDALRLVTQARALAGDNVNFRAMVIRAQALAGQRDAALAAAGDLDAAVARREVQLRDRYRAYLELGLGRSDRALEAFEGALKDRDPSLVWIAVDPRVDGLRGDPRFDQIVRALGLD
jgi:eukaryotic-like serine/threonine-protein kinase